MSTLGQFGRIDRLLIQAVAAGAGRSGRTDQRRCRVEPLVTVRDAAGGDEIDAAVAVGVDPRVDREQRVVAVGVDVAQRVVPQQPDFGGLQTQIELVARDDGQIGQPRDPVLDVVGFRRRSLQHARPAQDLQPRIDSGCR